MKNALVKDGKIEQYPYSYGQLIYDNPEVSFPREPNDAVMAEYGVVVVVESEPPVAPFKMAVEQAPEFVKGEWRQVWVLEDSPVPGAISPLQARRALRTIEGLKEQVDAFVATLSDEDQETWEYAVEVRRDNAIIKLGQEKIPALTDAVVDYLFRVGATL